MRPKPGDKILIILDAWDILDTRLCDAPRGSIARALSYEEYRDDRQRFWNSDPDLLANVKKWMEQGVQYPFRIESVAPLAPEEEGIAVCKVGDVIILDERFFEVIKDEGD